MYNRYFLTLLNHQNKNLTQIAECYPNVWFTESKGYNKNDLGLKQSLVFLVIDRTCNGKMTYCIGKKDEKEALIYGVWFDDIYNGTFMIRYNTQQYPQMSICATGRVKHDSLIDENDKNFQDEINWKAKIENADHILYQVMNFL